MTATMGRALRLAIVAALLAYAFADLIAYRAEWQIAEANALLSKVLRRLDSGNQGVVTTTRALEQSRHAMQSLPGDARPVLLAGSALTLLGKGSDALALLQPFVALAERPELVVALGRAHASIGNESAARVAFLRAAWASPVAIATLPKAARQVILDEVHSLESQLITGQLTAPPQMTAP